MTQLFHVSEDGRIERFEPRDSPTPHARVTQPSVWAVDDRHLVNYLLPRDCPRVTFYRLENSAPEDAERLIGPLGSTHVVAIEDAWLERAIRTEIWIYHLPGETFQCIDAGAGYYVSPDAVAPIERRLLENPLLELVSRGCELRVVNSLWPLRDAVVASTLQFSCIRMRNAKPRNNHSNRDR